jgi:hypothetical protein
MTALMKASPMKNYIASKGLTSKNEISRKVVTFRSGYHPYHGTNTDRAFCVHIDSPQRIRDRNLAFTITAISTMKRLT